MQATAVERLPKPVTIRPALPDDRAAILELGARCSPDTMRKRFHGPVTEFPARYLEWILGPGSHADNLLALTDGRAVGLATFQPTGPGRGEVAVLVEDGWQHHGVGTRLVRRLAARAYARHDDVIEASVMTDNLPALGLLRASGADGKVEFSGTTLLVSVPLHAAG
jgi:GNAT superfamily N-acetyltransferase